MKQSACFIGHRKINYTPVIRETIRQTVLNLIQTGTVNFIFGDHSAFNTLCYDIVTELKADHPHIQRIHFRKDYENADPYTMQFLSENYEKSICPPGVGSAGRASYVERNQAMIEESDICVFYYSKDYIPPLQKSKVSLIPDRQVKSGTALAYAYAVKKKKTIINLYCDVY